MKPCNTRSSTPHLKENSNILLNAYMVKKFLVWSTGGGNGRRVGVQNKRISSYSRKKAGVTGRTDALQRHDHKLIRPDARQDAGAGRMVFPFCERIHDRSPGERTRVKTRPDDGRSITLRIYRRTSPAPKGMETPRRAYRSQQRHPDRTPLRCSERTRHSCRASRSRRR